MSTRSTAKLAAVSMLLSLLLAVTAGCTDQNAAPPMATSATIAFVNVNVVPMDRDHILEAQTVLIRDGKIAEIGPAPSVQVPPGAQRIDGTGKYVMPGLIDMIVFGLDEHRHLLYVANGVTTTRHMMGSLLQLDWRDRIAEGKLLGPTIFATSTVVDGAEKTVPVPSVQIETIDEVKQMVADHKQSGFDFVRVSFSVSADVYHAIVEEAEAQGLVVVGEIPTSVGLSNWQGNTTMDLNGVVAALQSADAPAFERIVEGIIPTRSLPAAAYASVDAARIADLASQMRAQSISPVVTLAAFQKNYQYTQAAQREAFLSSAQARYLMPDLTFFWQRFHRQTLSEATLAQAGTAYKHLKRLAKTLHEAGVPLLLGTHASLPYIAPGYGVHDELAQLVAAGLSPYEALKTGTYNAARALDALDQLGTLEVGKQADLILVENNPLADVAHVRENLGVMVNGRWLSHSDLETMLEARVAFYAQEDRFMGILEQDGVEAARTRWQEARAQDATAQLVRETRLMSYAYKLIGVDKAYDVALDLLQLSTEMFERPWYTYDTIGKAYAAKGDTGLAIEAYEQSLAIFPGNTNATKELAKLRDVQD